ncbi:hypothetical protein [Pontibacter sp. G13]|uniref:hypothetical protein n=1 Tax=Pontibacter sp. G13 TaxID=3074898 RepID=UPI00288A5DDE|nr:hypothetical protein [Pontibacter sp. G13]WNJ17898.1 hypothetical protein RJD25_23845 [Pontibacter sp. G13]
MKKHKNEEWYKSLYEDCIEKYNDVPPPWVMNPDTHPYSIGWRMGGGETYMMFFSEWFDETHVNEKNRIDYFLKYPVQPRYLGWLADFIWGLRPWEVEDFDYSLYFKKLEDLGFKGTKDYKEDLEDEKWLSS